MNTLSSISSKCNINVSTLRPSLFQCIIKSLLLNIEVSGDCIELVTIWSSDNIASHARFIGDEIYAVLNREVNHEWGKTRLTEVPLHFSLQNNGITKWELSRHLSDNGWGKCPFVLCWRTAYYCLHSNFDYLIMVTSAPVLFILYYCS